MCAWQLDQALFSDTDNTTLAIAAKRKQPSLIDRNSDVLSYITKNLSLMQKYIRKFKIPEGAHVAM